MKKSSYEKTTYLAKVRRLRILAEDSLRGWPLKIKRLEFIKLSANAIFKVTDSRNRKYQLRINPDNYHTKPALMEEITWLNHIIKSTDIIVPKPIANNLDDYVTEGLHPSMPSKRLCVLFEWLPGKTRWHSINKDYAYTLGALIGQLQKNGKSIPIKHRRYWDADGLVGTNKAKFYNVEKLSSATPREQKVITEARRRSYRKLKDYEQTYLEKVGLIHGDMQPNNILIYKNHYAVIDFDDCGTGLYGDDLAIALIALEQVAQGSSKKSFDELKDALFIGYSEHMPFYQKDIDLLPYFVLARHLVSLAWLEVRRDNPSLRPYYRQGVKKIIKFFHDLEKNKISYRA